MNSSDASAKRIVNPRMLWAGRILTGLVSLAFGMSGIMKLRGGSELAEGMKHLGLPDSMVIPLAILELTCLAIYLIPTTSVVGAILLTGYMGGAIFAHWRVDDAFITQIVIGVLVWIAVCLREPRLWALMPWRRGGD